MENREGNVRQQGGKQFKNLRNVLLQFQSVNRDRNVEKLEYVLIPEVTDLSKVFGCGGVRKRWITLDCWDVS